MKHVDTWHDIAMRHLSLALILEDDALFVPFFKEKFNRLIYTSIRTGALRINKACLIRPLERIPNDEWVHQEPMLVIGTCFGFHDKSFEISSRKASPILSTHKQSSSRCAHAYLLTVGVSVSGSVPGNPEPGLDSVPGNPEPELGSVPGNPEPELGSVPGNPELELGSVPGNPEPELGSVPGNPEPELGSVSGNPEPGLGYVLENPKPGLRTPCVPRVSREIQLNIHGVDIGDI